MRRIVMACAGIMLAVLLSACVSPGSSETGAAATDDTLSGLREVVLTVHGLSCPLCSNNLDGQLRRIDGVEEATIDLKTGAVTVRLTPDHSVSRARLAAAVDAAGFTLKDIQTTEN